MIPLIKLENVTFSYGDGLETDSVLKEVSLEIKKGSFVAVLGHNGSGKSTLAKLLNGLLKPDSGRVLVSGMDTKNENLDKEIKRTVGMVFQNPDNQLVATVVEEDVAFGLENLGIPYDEMHKRVDEALQTVGMLDYKKTEPHNLSGGQKQRIAIAGILAMKPECVVLDEPTSMLDPAGRNDVINTIVSMCRDSGVTVVLITHFMQEALLADRVIVMNDGEISLDGSPNDVFSRVELLNSIGLEVPASKELAYKLEKSGIKIDNNTLSEEDYVNAITSYLRRYCNG